MAIQRTLVVRAILLISLIVNLTAISSNLQADSGSCGGATVIVPFIDVSSSPFFCQIAAAYFSGLTNGTSDTTYSPAANVTREQMAAFITRTMDQSLKRGSERAVTEKWWTPQNANSLTLTDVGGLPEQVKFDRANLWLSNFSEMLKIRQSDGKVLDTWAVAISNYG